VWAEAVVKKDILKKVLKIQAEKFHKVTQDKCLLGSIISGSLGFNAHYANIIAAFFIACGQDLAHTVEGSMGITTTNDINGDLYISINLPSLIVGTVGGGTGLEAQKSALELLGIKGGNSGQNAAKLSEIIAASVLCGELSLLASISEGSLAAAHQKLARGEKK
jgi:hydroxymethylglutaryl-CoA reductase (NADPH)